MKGTMKYFVYNHHDFWQWPMGENGSINADVAFMWADWPFSREINMLRMLGKKVITYEHGFGSMWDYEVNNRNPISDGYLVLGQKSKESLMRAGVPEERILITGNPIYDDVKKTEHKGKRALYVALHWVGDRRDYNEEMYNSLREAYDFDWTLKLINKTTDFGTGKKWYNDVDGKILEDIKEKLPKYDMVFTPRASTFESFARLMGIPVYVVDEMETYKGPGEPNRIPMDYTFLKVGEDLPKQKKINDDDYIKRPSLNIEEILNWTKTL